MQEAGVSEIYTMAGHLIRRLNQISTAVFAERIGGLGVDLTPVQYAALETVRENPGIDQVLKEAGAGLAVVTNKLTLFTEPLLAELELAAFFDAIVCGDTTDNPKPAADMALHSCKLLNVAPKDALFVGDSAADVGCARAAGCPVVVVRDGYNHGTPAHELGADAVIESFSDLV